MKRNDRGYMIFQFIIYGIGDIISGIGSIICKFKGHNWRKICRLSTPTVTICEKSCSRCWKVETWYE